MTSWVNWAWAGDGTANIQVRKRLNATRRPVREAANEEETNCRIMGTGDGDAEDRKRASGASGYKYDASSLECPESQK
jgi:hypothetical protein